MDLSNPVNPGRWEFQRKTRRIRNSKDSGMAAARANVDRRQICTIGFVYCMYARHIVPGHLLHRDLNVIVMQRYAHIRRQEVIFLVSGSLYDLCTLIDAQACHRCASG